ncbi:hypothetical protein J1N35_027941 [Gossypium stocksii]|uniref:Mitotic-spindle organizing protein 1 n=1 Tax=Gossypium stocksii TaxID=47602 RepID=A0A9D3VDK5_9ROSI|nr:hypothetical protein J1N35_027941 [Gossypium stocksii]
MDPEAARTARESLDLAFQMSNILDTGLDRHTLSVLIALCDLGLNPEALAAVVKELQREPPPSTPLPSSSSQLRALCYSLSSASNRYITLLSKLIVLCFMFEAKMVKLKF